MSAQRGVRFESPPNGLQSPSYSPNFIFDLATSDDGASERDVEKEQAQAWAQRPKSTPWTSRPQSLREKLRPRWWRDIIIDVFSILMPVPFFILAVIILFVNGKEAEDWALTALEQSIKAVTTIFPIFFAGLTGRAAVKFATWKLEQGSSLGLLEQLMGSRTVISTITTQLRLRTFNWIGLGLIGMWLLSPLGSQAILRVLETPFSPIPSNCEVTYANSRAQSYAAADGPFKLTWYAGFTMLYGASLLAPAAVKASPMDLWGNVKIPFYSSINSSATPDSEGWTQIPEGSVPTYSSLFGIPMSSVPLGNTTLSIESSYVTLDCGNLTLPDASSPAKNHMISPNGPFLSKNEIDAVAPWAIGYKGPDVAPIDGAFFNDSDIFVYLYPQSCPDCLPFNISSENSDPGTLVYQEFDYQDNATSVFCVPSQAYIESSIACERTANSHSCKVTAQRPSRLPHMPSTITPLSFRTVILGLTSLLPNATPQGSLTNPTQAYLYNPWSETGIIAGTDSIGLIGGESPPSPLPEISMQDFSDRFGQIINTFLYASMWNATPYITGAPFSGMVESPAGGHAASLTAATSIDLQNMIQNRTGAFTVPATLTVNLRIFKVSYQWMAIFLLCTFAMLCSSVIGVIFSRNTVVPDYLGYVSTLAKESPYVRMPHGGANLDGMDRARLMKNLRVRLGNVDEGRGGEIGKLAFARMEETGVVRKDSFYV